MKDLDFDELDRAVNSLMSTAGSTAAPKPDGTEESVVEIVPQAETPAPVVADQQPTIPPVVASHALGADAPLPAEVEADAQVSPAVVPRKAGRFMDVMHKSSDMRMAARTPGPPSTQPARFGGPTLQPTTNNVEPEPIAPTASVTESSPEPVQEASMPDPIDFAMSSNNEAAEAIAPASDDAQLEPRPYSPFVPDAKVEKRPLGSADVAEMVAPTPTYGQQVTADRVLEPDVASQLPAAPDEQLPAELQSDLIAIESSEPVVEQESSQAEAMTDSLNPEPSAKPDIALAAAPRPKIESIPNQYATKPKKTESEAEADIFNTEAFSQPLAHPAKSKSGWWTVFFIFLLIVLGAGIGALVYLFVL